MKTSRRAFVGASAAAATHMWIPKAVNGYSVEDVVGPVTPHQAGISKWDLDTPALCVDLDKMQRNIDKLQRVCTANKIAVRPHAKTHKCAEIAKLQMKAGAIGICTAKVSEAEALSAGGVDRLVMTTANLPPAKIRSCPTRMPKRCKSGSINSPLRRRSNCTNSRWPA